MATLDLTVVILAAMALANTLGLAWLTFRTRRMELRFKEVEQKRIADERELMSGRGLKPAPRRRKKEPPVHPDG